MMEEIVVSAQHYQGCVFSEIDASSVPADSLKMHELRNLAKRLGGTALGTKKNVFVFPFPADSLRGELKRANLIGEEGEK